MLTRRRHRIPPQPGNWFANLLECMGEALEVHVASYQGKPVAAIITLLHKNTVTYKYGGSDQDFHHLGSMPFVLWKSIQKAQAIGAQTFDLGRSEAHNIGGVTFKDRWDSRRSVLTYWRFSRPAQAHSLARSHRFRLAQTFFGMLPDPLLKLTGALMYRHSASRRALPAPLRVPHPSVSRVRYLTSTHPTPPRLRFLVCVAQVVAGSARPEALAVSARPIQPEF